MLLIPDIFKGQYSIPNFGDKVPLSNKLGVDTFVLSIEQDQVKRELIGLLGFEMYRELYIHITENLESILKPSAPVEYKDLVLGRDDFIGLARAIAPFAYFMYLRESNSDLTGAGVKTVDSKSGASYPANEKAVNAYNQYIKSMYGDNANPNVIEWGGMFSVDWSGTNNGMKSVWDFLEENKTDYPLLVLGNKKGGLMNYMEI